ncbi:MAG: sigma-70 family RNA polymerase sigma factor [Planctomycetota bacterium]
MAESAAEPAPVSILHRVAQGDEAAVKECLDTFGGIVWTLARRMLPRGEDPADAVQDIFIELWRKADRYDPNIASEKTFVAMLTRRRLIDRLRRHARTPATAELNEAAHVPTDNSIDRVEISEEAARIRELMKKLSPDQQRVLQLSISEGWSHRQIAESLDMPLGTVKTHARRGLMRVREMLAKETGSPGESVGGSRGGAA